MTTTRFARTVLAAAAGLALCAAAQAQEKITYMTNWYAQAEHGGFYQAVATRRSTSCSSWPPARPTASWAPATCR
jgi:ABC-type nitrate/sulfonate/bicarbonate transport system substrate-binding protein